MSYIKSLRCLSTVITPRPMLRFWMTHQRLHPFISAKITDWQSGQSADSTDLSINQLAKQLMI